VTKQKLDGNCGRVARRWVIVKGVIQVRMPASVALKVQKRIVAHIARDSTHEWTFLGIPDSVSIDKLFALEQVVTVSAQALW